MIAQEKRGPRAAGQNHARGGDAALFREDARDLTRGHIETARGAVFNDGHALAGGKAGHHRDCAPRFSFCI